MINTTCIIGIGNPLCSDDGVGAFVCQQLEEKKLHGVKLITVHQLDTSLAEEIAMFKNVVFVDASVEEENISFQQLSEENNQPQSSSHHINAAMLVSVAKKLYPSTTHYYLLAIGGENFEIGEYLSKSTLANAYKAIETLVNWHSELA